MEETLRTLQKVLEPYKGKVYLVGGCVRDYVMELKPHDFDLVIDTPLGPVVEYLRIRSECSGFAEYPRFLTAKFNLQLPSGNIAEIELVEPRTEKYEDGPRKPSSVQAATIAEDAGRRDFCCNALYQDLWDPTNILDPTGRGKSDIRNRILSTPSDNPEYTFKEDPLRMLRGIRFECTLEFKLARNIPGAIEKVSRTPEWRAISRERINSEFTKILMSAWPRNIEGLRKLYHLGLLGNICPPLAKTWGVNQKSPYHSQNLWEHLIGVLGSVTLFDTASLELRLAALFHDISKLTDYQEKPDGTRSYHGHQESSAREAREILKDLRYPEKVIDKVVTLIRGHMSIKQLAAPDPEKQGHYIYTGRLKTTRRMMRTYGDLLPDLLELIDADNLNHAPTSVMPGQVDSFREAMENIKTTAAPTGIPINGHGILLRYPGITGPQVGQIKKALIDIYLSRESLEIDGLWEAYDEKYGSKVFGEGQEAHLWPLDYNDYLINHSLQCAVEKIKHFFGSLIENGEVLEVKIEMNPQGIVGEIVKESGEIHEHLYPL